VEGVVAMNGADSKTHATDSQLPTDTKLSMFTIGSLVIGVTLGVGLFYLGLHSTLPVAPILFGSLVACTALVITLVVDCTFRGLAVMDNSRFWRICVVAAPFFLGILAGFASTLSIADPTLL